MGYNIETMAETQTGHNNHMVFNIIYCVRFNLKMSQSLTGIIISCHTLKRQNFIISHHINNRFRGALETVSLSKNGLHASHEERAHIIQKWSEEKTTRILHQQQLLFPESYVCVEINDPL